MKRTLLLCIILGNCTLQVIAQSSISLNEAILMSQNGSLESHIAKNMAQAEYWNYNSFRASRKPYLSLSSVIPNYSRIMNRITLPSGEDQFVYQNQSYSTLNLRLSQNVGLTGGTFSVYSSLNRIDIFGNQRSHQYSTVPFSISYNQSLLYNDLKWQKQIMPLQFEQSKKDFAERMESIAISTVEKYFNYLIAQMQLAIDEQNLKTADTLLKITKAKFGIGTRDKNDMLQAEHNLLSVQNEMDQNRINLEIAKQSFLQYLKLPTGKDIKLQVPDSISFFEINLETAIREAGENRQKVIEFRKRRLEAERNLAQTKASSGPSLSVLANFGASQTNVDFLKAYQDLQKQQSLSIQIEVPILNWGVNKSRRNRAQADLDLIKNSIEQEQIAFEQEIVLQTMQWNTIKNKLDNARKTQNIALERYEIATQKYLAGTLTFMEFTNAQYQKDLSLNSYIQHLRSYWNSYFTLRRLTMYDFRDNKKIDNKYDYEL